MKHLLIGLTLSAGALSAASFAGESPLTMPESGEAFAPGDHKLLVEERLREGLEWIAENPWPEPAKGSGWNLNHAYVKAVTTGEAGSLNTAVLDYCADYTLDPGKAPTAYHDPRPQAALYSLYLKPRYNRLLTPKAKDAIEDVCWRWVFRHSFISEKEKWPLNNPTKSVWYISGSENHCAAQRAANLLSLQVLLKAGKGTGELYDGHTVAEHYREWVKWFPEFFHARRREGLTCEIAHSSSYGNATINHYYEIEGLTDSPGLKQAARDFLTVFWANVACEFEPRTGIRASLASTRCYKWSWTQSGMYWAKALLYAYGWSDIEAKPNLTQVSQFTSGYRPPAILRAIARDRNRGSYMGTSRRFGRGTGWDRGVYQVVFDDGAARNSHMRRDTWYTEAYTMSALSLDPGRDYIELVDQSRVMGVTFSSDIGDRLVVYAGNRPADKKVEYKMTTSKGVNGVVGPNCLIVARDINADSKTSNSTRVFVSDGELWENREENENGWFFTRAGDGYTAFRIAGGYEVVPSPYGNGYFVEFCDIWVPMVIQMAQAKDYKDDFAAFKAAVNKTSFAYKDRKLTYTSLSGKTYEYWSKSKALAKIDGEPIDLNPPMAYDFPYLKMKHGEDTATISYPGYPDLIVPRQTSAR